LKKLHTSSMRRARRVLKVIKLLQVDKSLCEVVEWVELVLSFSCRAHLLLHNVVIVSVVSYRLSGI